MRKKNFFVKLLLWETKKEELLLLYGFCSPTEQEPYNGKLTAVPKTRRLIWQVILPEEQELEFTAEEPMVKVVVQIWEEDSGALIFSRSRTLMRYVNLCCMMRSTPYQLSDPYSSSLKKAASNRTKEIEEQIETVARVTEWKSSNTSECKNEIEYALEEGQRLFSPYSYAKPKGAFIKNEQKDGEIQSFRKIREYMEAGDIVHIVIADPYFSVEAAEKLLTRINRRKVRVKIFTSLPEFNPDTGEKLPDNGAAFLQKWLGDKEPFLHHNLWVGNLKRGRTQVFHDRYLLRYFEDGRMDGFLLSNSLNSMGQLYPFVIAPMEREVFRRLWKRQGIYHMRMVTGFMNVKQVQGADCI